MLDNRLLESNGRKMNNAADFANFIKETRILEPYGRHVYELKNTSFLKLGCKFYEI